MALARLQPSQTLAVLLDENGARNVPESAIRDCYQVVSVTPPETHFRVTIREGPRN